MTDADFQSGVNRYMNPYEDAVVQSTLGDINRSADVQRGQLASRQAGRRSFGDTSSALQSSELQRNLMSQIGQTTGNLRYQGFNNAAQMGTQQFNQERANEFQAAGGFGNLSQLQAGMGNTMRGNYLEDLRNKLGAGGQIQNQNQRMLDVTAREIYGRRDFPLTQLQNYGNLLGAFPTGATTQQNGPTGLQQLGGLGMAAGGLYNDWNKYNTSMNGTRSALTGAITNPMNQGFF